MIYISSACVAHRRIADSVRALADHGFRNIELSGGTEFYENLESDLLQLKQEYGLRYLVHNYFPPPREAFVLNLASMNDDVYQSSIAHLREAAHLSRRLGGKKLGFHAGFFFDVRLDEIGKTMTRVDLTEKSLALKRYVCGYDTVREEAEGVELYVENNVLSSKNAAIFAGQRPYMLLDHDDYVELRQRMELNLLLDVGHLKVSCRSLTLDFEAQLSRLLPLSDYVHLSDNDGFSDQNRCIQPNAELMQQLKKFDWTGKIISFEMYQSLSAVKACSEQIAENFRIN